MLIRALTNDDFDQWLRLWMGYQVFYKAAIPEETSQVSFTRMSNADEPMFGALAWQSGQAVGLVHWIFHRSNWTIGNYCYLQDLYVDEASRGRGVGRALIEHVYEHAKESNCSRVYWLTHETNTNAMQLYNKVAERTGFIQYRKLLATAQ